MCSKLFSCRWKVLYVCLPCTGVVLPGGRPKGPIRRSHLTYNMSHVTSGSRHTGLCRLLASVSVPDGITRSHMPATDWGLNGRMPCCTEHSGKLMTYFRRNRTWASNAPSDLLYHSSSIYVSYPACRALSGENLPDHM